MFSFSHGIKLGKACVHHSVHKKASLQESGYGKFDWKSHYNVPSCKWLLWLIGGCLCFGKSKSRDIFFEFIVTLTGELPQIQCSYAHYQNIRQSGGELPPVQAYEHKFSGPKIFCFHIVVVLNLTQCFTHIYGIRTKRRKTWYLNRFLILGAPYCNIPKITSGKCASVQDRSIWEGRRERRVEKCVRFGR